MGRRLIWIHEDALSLRHPVLEGRNEHDVVCFIWDEEHLRSMGYGFQRLVFIYETLCEMGVAIRRGPVVSSVIEWAESIQASEVWVPASVNPAHQDLIRQMERSLTVTVVPEHPFVIFDRPPKLRRFFGYWKAARSQLMRPS